MKLKELLAKSHGGIAVVFDLDSTLFDVSQRTKKIVYTFIQLPHIMKKFPKECRKVKTIGIKFKDWGLKDTFQKYGSGFSKDFVKYLNVFWQEHFFRGESFQYDLPYKGAVDFVQKLAKNQNQIFYLTARSEKSRTHTQKVLKKWSFPVIHDHLFLKKEDFQDVDSIYKTYVIRLLAKRFEEVWFFDNDPKNLLRIEKEAPEVQIIFLDTVHCGTCTPKKSWFSVTAPHFFEDHLKDG